jgi:hypothetical protein
LKRLSSENLPCPLFTKEGKFLPFAKGGKEGLEGRCLDNYGRLSNLVDEDELSEIKWPSEE